MPIMIRLTYALIMLLLAPALVFAQQKTGRRHLLNGPVKTETLPVKPGVGWRAPVAANAIAIKPKTPVVRRLAKLPVGMQAVSWTPSTPQLGTPPSKGKKNATPLPLTVYRPTTPKGIKTLSACDSITLTRQSQIDSFPLLYPGCTTVQYLIIDGRGALPAITRLDSLKQITEIARDLSIFRTGIPNLSGINNITKIGYYLWLDSNYAMTSMSMYNLQDLGGLVLYNSPLLSNLDGFFDALTDTELWSVIFGNLGVNSFAPFSKITRVINFSIALCENITSLDGFENLEFADFAVQLFANRQLTDISQLSKLRQTAFLEVSWSDSLKSLQGLQNIVTISRKIRLDLNVGLTNLNDFNPDLVVGEAIETDDELVIMSCFNLPTCAVPFLCRYLASGLPATIQNNAPGCNTIAEIIASCPQCTADTAIWNGNESNGWNDTLNWTPRRIPSGCTKVIIPAGTPNDPALYSNVSIGGLEMENSTLYLEGYNLNVKNSLSLKNAGIYNGGNMTVDKVMNPLVDNCRIEANFTCQDYSGKADFLFNYFSQNVLLSDSSGRAERSFTFFNETLGNFTLINNSDYGQNYLSNASPLSDVVYGKLTVVNNADAGISVGLGGPEPPLRVYGDVEFRVNGGSIDVSNISFDGNQEQHLSVSGLVPDGFGASQLFLNKIGGGNLILNQDFTVFDFLRFTNNGGFIKTAANKLLIIDDGCAVTDINNLSGSFVNGPVKKIGNTPFVFPIGEIRDNKAWQGPLGITSNGGGSNTDAFTAQYFRKNPSVDGYDTAQYALGFGGIQGKEYWQLDRNNFTNATSNVVVTLPYDSLRSGVNYRFSEGQVAGWFNNKWNSWGNGGYVGTIAAGRLQSSEALTSYGPITFSYKPLRKPIITVGPSDTLACAGIGFRLRFSLDTAMVFGNIFRAQLSDSFGNFQANSPIIGSKFGTNSDSITAFLPGDVAMGKLYRIRILGTLPLDTSVNTVSVRTNRLPQQTFSIVGPATVCLGTGPVKYYPSIVENGVTYNLTLESGGGTITKVGDTSFVTFTNPSAGNTVTMRTSNACGNGSPISQLTVVVNAPAPTAAPLLTSVGRWLYATALPTGAIGIRWLRNGETIAGASSTSYYASTAGNYTAQYFNNCGNSPASNAISFAAASVPQTITFGALPNKVFTDAPFAIAATTTSGLPVQLTLLSGPGNLTAGTFTITGVGTVTIGATQPGDAIYDTAAPVVQSFVVSKAPQSILFSALPDLTLGSPGFLVPATSTAGLPVRLSLTGPANLSSQVCTPQGLGSVTITATQEGNPNFFSATTVSQSFCVVPPTLTSIAGAPFVCPAQTATYSINTVPGLVYNWRLSNGAAFPSNTSSATITWPTTPGTYTLIVAGTGPCGAPTPNDSLVVTVANPVTPGVVGNMLPANGIREQSLPLSLSWLPGTNALTYDVYVWDSTVTQPATPLATNLTGLLYTLEANALAYNRTYNWRVVSKNACLQTSGPIQRFRLRKVPDLFVTNVQTPTAANSGQTITINWTVRNLGPGNTTTSQQWNDAVFLSFDTLPNFSITPNTSAAAWNQLEFPVRPLLVGTKPNVAALDSGQQYNNSINFTLPLNYGQPLYAYVITNYAPGVNAPLQTTVANDTARAANATVATVSPTPDLRVDTVFVPTTTFSGSAINLSYRVKNYGVLTPAGAIWTDKIYVSPSPIFNLSNAVPAKQPKPYGNYYPSAFDAVVPVGQQLQADSSYTRALQIVVPNFIQGSYFVHVFTNANAQLYEGSLSQNNINHSVIQVFLTPTPQLTLGSILLPQTTASITQPIGINWIVRNIGFNDNIEKNRGHYFVPSGFCSVIVGDRRYLDSLGFGGSAWVDKVYLSTNPNETSLNNAVELGTFQQGSPRSIASSIDGLMPEVCSSFSPPANVNTTNVLRPGSNHAGNLTVLLPHTLPQGTYYVYVHANANKTVFEFPDTPSIRRSGPLVVQRPDLTVTQLTVPATATGAVTVTGSYSVQNNGPGVVFNAARRDKVYVSEVPLFNATAQLIETNTITATLPLGAPTNHSFTYTFPPGTAGTRYFFVVANADSLFRENNYTNNLSAAASVVVTAAVPADLQVTAVQLPDSVWAYRQNTLRYSIANVGSAPAIGESTDSIFMSCNPVFNYNTSFLLAVANRVRNISAGASVADSIIISPTYGYFYHSCFARANTSPMYVFVKVNSKQTIYEGGSETNNLGISAVRTLVNTHVDHIVTMVSAADTATVGRPYRVNWQVKNRGYSAPTSLYGFWNDALYFSSDSVFNNNALVASSFSQSGNLKTNETYSEALTAIVPKLPTGDYYALVLTNERESILAELDRTNNANFIRNAQGAAKKIHIVQPLLPDLVDSITALPLLVAVGQPLAIKHRVSNIGPGVTYPGAWSHGIWLSTDFVAGNAGDLLLSGSTRTATLATGQFYEDSATAIIPTSFAPGNYLVLSVADPNNTVIETNDTNNTAIGTITVFLPPATDLLVEGISTPDTAFLGYPLQGASWTVRNASANPAAGISTDGIYLSKGRVLDSSATLLASVGKVLNIPALGSATVSLEPIVSDVTEGDYEVLVKTDLLNNIVESNKDNNTGIGAKKLHVAAKPLQLGIAETNTLQRISRIYKLRIPDSLRGATILVTLTTNDSLTMRNEMYIGGGYVPNAARFDYRFEIPNAGNQQIVMNAVNDSAYYILVRSVSPNPSNQNIKLLAVKLPFAILQVRSNAGGNGGNVTVRISGSLFTPNMTAKLQRGAGTIAAQAVYFTNSTTVFATFPLQGRPLGIYDVILSKGDTATAKLEQSFSIVNPNNGGLNTGGGVNTGPTNSGNLPGCDPGADGGLNSALTTEIIIPEKVFAGWPFQVQINYTNPTNMDVPAQVRILYNNKEVPMALSQAGLPQGTTGLYLQLTEPGGPPGIIRAGASGTIVVYARAPEATPGHTIVKFNLK
ncbi:MAG: hypothetical protein EAY75_12680 [Bacteroidetes bacterium]|nr:MAG: hypothetical protein EAY75_12680 [Bacteroidota bacterium]